jgi:hypothetical protein
LLSYFNPHRLTAVGGRLDDFQVLPFA